MKNTLKNMFLILLWGVFGVVTGELKTLSVMEGDSVTLHTDLTDIQTDYMIVWTFAEEGSTTLLVQMFKTNISYVDGRFRDRLHISDPKTGDLTIKNMRIKHSGLYEAEIITANGKTHKTFTVIVSESPRVLDADTCDVKSVLKEGDSVTLHIGVQTQRGDLILWRFGDDGVLIAKDDKEDNKISIYDDNGRLRGRLKMNDKTGSLTISDVRSSDLGLYKLKISSNNRQTLYKTFNVSLRGSSSDMSSNAIAVTICSILSFIAAALIFYFCCRRTSQQRDTLELSATDPVKFVPVSERYSDTRTSETSKTTENSRTRLAQLGGSVTLDTDVTKIQTDEGILWTFGSKNSHIAQFNGGAKPSLWNYTDERFKDKLKLNCKTGDLTINNITVKHSGVYEAQIYSSSRVIQYRTYIVTIFVEAGKGESVTMHTEAEIQRGDRIKWTSENKTTLVTGMNGDFSETLYTDDGRFRDRLELNHQTGDLTITDITSQHSGEYSLYHHSCEGKISYRMFSVYVIEKTQGKDLQTPGEEKNEQKADSAEISRNESGTVMMPLLNEDDMHGQQSQ